MLLLCRCCCGYFFFRFKLRVDFFTRFSVSWLSVCLYVAFNIELAVSCHCTLPINVLYTLSTAFTHSTRTIQKSEKNKVYITQLKPTTAPTPATAAAATASSYQEVKKRVFLSSTALALLKCTSQLCYTYALSYPHVCIRLPQYQFSRMFIANKKPEEKHTKWMKRFCNLRNVTL